MAVTLFFGGVTPPALGESASRSDPLRNATRRASIVPTDNTPTERDRALTRDAFAGFWGRRAWRVENQLLPFITHIEDNHGDAHAQWAAVDLLDRIDKERGDAPLLIGVEGAWTALDLSALAKLPPGDWRARWWKHLLWRGDLTGEEYWVLSRAPARVALVGVDDPSLHERNTEARRQLEFIQPAAQRDLQSLRDRLTRLKPKFHTGPWSALDRAFSSEPTAADGAQALARQIQAIVPQSWTEIHLPNLYRLARWEDSPPTPKAVQEEIERLLSLAPQETARLFSTTKSSESDLFLRRLLSLAEARQVPLPLTRRYAEQRALNAALDPVGLSQEIDSAPDALASLLLPAGSRSRALFEADRTLNALESVLALKATPAEWARLRDMDEKWVFTKLDKTLHDLDRSAGLPALSRTGPPPAFVQSLLAAKNFYQLAEARNDAMAYRLLKEARQRNTERCVLVAGGFHTPGIAALFRRWGAPFEVLCPVPSPRPSLREIDGFQDPARKAEILQQTAAALSLSDPQAAREWVSQLSKDEQQAIDRSPTLIVRLLRWVLRWIRRAAEKIAILLMEHQDVVRRLHGARVDRGFRWPLLIGPAYLLPPSSHQTTPEWQPAPRKRPQGNSGFQAFHNFVNANRWVEAENWLWGLSALDGSTRRVGQAFMELPPATRAQLAQNLTPGALGFLGDALTEYARTQDLERLFQLRAENIKIAGALAQIPDKAPSTTHPAVAGLKTALKSIHQSLINEAADVWATDEQGVSSAELMEEGDPDDSIVRQTAQTVEKEARALAKSAQTLLKGWETGPNGPWKETNEFIGALKKHLQVGIKDIAFPTATETNNLSGLARAKLRAVREWARLRRSFPAAQQAHLNRTVMGAWRAAESFSRSLTEGKLIDPLASAALTTVSAYGAVPENNEQLRQTQSALRQPRHPIVVLDVPYEDAKDPLLKDLAAALAGTEAGVAGPRRLLRVQLSRLGDTVPERLSALRKMIENAEALGGVGLAIDVDEADPLFQGVDAPFNNILQTWRGLANPPALVFLSSPQTHARHLNQATFDQAAVVSFPTGKASVQALLAMEAERIEAAGPCPVAPETLAFLADTIFSTGTVDFEEAVRALRWAAARRIVNGDPSPLRASDLPLQTEVPFRELPVSRQYKLAAGRTEPSYADRLKIAYNEWLAAPRGTAFYTQALAFLQHALRLSILFPKESVIDHAEPLTDAQIAAERQRARRFFDQRLYGLNEQKDAVIDNYITKPLMHQGDRSDAPFDILCLVGPPSTAKSEMARLLGEFTKTKVVRIDAAAASAGSEIFGTVRTYVGAQPGRPALAMEENETDDLLFIIEELGNATPAFFTALNRFLDKRHAFEDHYHQVPIKRGRIKIIVNTNYWDRIPPDIRDRLIRVDFPKYSPADMKDIGVSILWPNVAAEFSFPKEWAFCPTPAAVVTSLVDNYLVFDNLRELERRMRQVHESAIVAALEAPPSARPITIDTNFLTRVFGPPPTKTDWSTPSPSPGHLTGLGVLGENEGTLLPVQVQTRPLERGIVFTGSPGETMRTSVVTVGKALTELARRPGNPLSDRDLESLGLHVHLPGLANPKDGDSAGAAITLGAVSALTDRLVNPDLAVTGAIQADGQITAVGGIAAKVNAARAKGKRLIVVPQANQRALRTALERSEKPEPVMIEMGKNVELYIPQAALTPKGQVMIQGGPPIDLPSKIKAKAVRNGLYLKGPPAELAPLADKVSPPLTVILAKRMDSLVNDPRVLLPLEWSDPVPAILRSGRAPSAAQTASALGTIPTTEPAVVKDGSSVSPSPKVPYLPQGQGPQATANVYTTAAKIPLKTFSGDINPDTFLTEMDLNQRKKTLATLLDLKTVEAFATLEALLRALWVISPAEAGQCFEALFNSKKGPLFTQVPQGAVGLGIPALAHMLAAVDDAGVAFFTADTLVKKMTVVEQDLASLKSDLPYGDTWKTYSEKLTSLMFNDYSSAEEQARLLAQRTDASRFHEVLSRFWTNRRDRLKSLCETASMVNFMAEKLASASNENREAAIQEFRTAMARLLLRYQNFLETERMGVEARLLDESQESLRHPLSERIGQTRLDGVRLEMLDWLTRGTVPRGEDVERHGRRLAGIQRSLTSLEILISYGTFRDRSRNLVKPQAMSDWAAPALALAEEAASHPGARIGAIVAPSRHQRSQLPNLIAAQLQGNPALPLLAKTVRVLELDLGQIHSANPEELMERLETYVATARATESSLLIIDLPGLKSRCGTAYDRMLNRLIQTANGPSDHPPLALIFTADPDSHALASDEVPRYVDQTHAVTLPPLTREEIVATVTQLAVPRTEGGSPQWGSPELWRAALNDGRIADDIDEAIEVLTETVGEARQEPAHSMDEALLNRVIDRRIAAKKANDSLVEKAEREIPNIPDETARRRGLEFLSWLKNLGSSDASRRVIVSNYLTWLLKWNWNPKPEPPVSLADIRAERKRARRVLDNTLIGQEALKKRILEIYLGYLWKRHRGLEPPLPVICLAGDYGAGKTTVMKAIADVFNFAYEEMSLAGESDPRRIKGTGHWIVGALPGLFYQLQVHGEEVAAKEKKNGVAIAADEIDKVVVSHLGNPLDPLLYFTDTKQRATTGVMDEYMGLPFRYSRMLLMTTVNRLDSLSPAQISRMEILFVPQLEEGDMAELARLRLLERTARELGLDLLPETGLDPSAPPNPARAGRRLDFGTEEERMALFDALVKDWLGGGTRDLERWISKILLNAAAELRQEAVVLGYEGLQPKRVRVEDLPRLLGSPARERGLDLTLASEPDAGEALFYENGPGAFVVWDRDTPGQPAELFWSRNEINHDTAPPDQRAIIALLSESIKLVWTVAQNRFQSALAGKQWVMDLHGVRSHQAADGALACFMALASRAFSTPLGRDRAFFGEIDLGGNLLIVPDLERRLLRARSDDIMKYHANLSPPELGRLMGKHPRLAGWIVQGDRRSLIVPTPSTVKEENDPNDVDIPKTPVDRSFWSAEVREKVLKEAKMRGITPVVHEGYTEIEFRSAAAAIQFYSATKLPEDAISTFYINRNVDEALRDSGIRPTTDHPAGPIQRKISGYGVTAVFFTLVAGGLFALGLQDLLPNVNILPAAVPGSLGLSFPSGKAVAAFIASFGLFSLTHFFSIHWKESPTAAPFALDTPALSALAAYSEGVPAQMRDQIQTLLSLSKTGTPSLTFKSMSTPTLATLLQWVQDTVPETPASALWAKSRSQLLKVLNTELAARSTPAFGWFPRQRNTLTPPSPSLTNPPSGAGIESSFEHHRLTDELYSRQV